ncbi:BTAD domain-containing putative transcriptional regulator [Actinoplanes flavus]|uniref:Winged helix-turn-helix domain-containing protein n=1 Tax=Actinoplanes flavus TaxID=2820290 RepID=A0ABS3UQ06_9ACTN|nr:BTAD domain-containing putative transcriptional regulator [Actinoplanes flavus]MBO3739772.1 winged helix-turn-helix domain-containing protein [Actinoplanes flavus]
MTVHPAADPLRFEILGVVRALRDGAPLDLGPAKQRAVLAVLLLNPGKPVPVHRIVDAVWGDVPPENGTNVVQKYVAGLRRVLDPDRSPRTPGELIALTDGGYVLRVGALDAEDFRTGLARADAERRGGDLEEAARRARVALDLWHGEALSGLTGGVFEAARLRLSEERASAWELWAEIELSRGGFAGLVSELSRLVQEFPLREGLRAQLMIALYRSGRQAEALAAFRDAREYFLDELGAEPGERLQETHRRILRNEPFYAEPVDPWADRAEPTPPPSSPAPPPPPPAADPVPAQPWSPPPYGPAIAYQPPAVMPGHLMSPRRTGIPVAEAVVAGILPVVTCSMGAWAYFVYAAFQRRTPRDVLTAAFYVAAFLAVIFFLAIDPSDLDSETTSAAEDIGFTLAFLTIPVAAVHGAILACHPGDTRGARTRRQLARQFAAVHPGGARQAGIGRPDLLRSFDDGGLVDLNHAPPQEIARLRGVTPIEAHRIALDRYERGPYHSPDDLARRGLLTDRTLHRIQPWLICVPPGQAAPPPAIR